MLNELEQGLSHLLGFTAEGQRLQEAASFSRLLSQWESRVQLSQVSETCDATDLGISLLIL